VKKVIFLLIKTVSNVEFSTLSTGGGGQRGFICVSLQFLSF
jgi:hypothetical protein